jgi:hypothetical protein
LTVGAVLPVAVLVETPAVLAAMPAAQTPAISPPSTPARKPVHPHKHHVSAAHPPAPQAQVAPAPVMPPPPKPPDWPVENPPNQASVTWDNHGLHIVASNSSLEQILRDVSTATGAKVEGLGTDERIFGAYGPGQTRDVLSQLLEGSGYNVVMIGDQSRGEPLEIVLSARGTVSQQQRVAAILPQNHDQEMDSQDQQPPDQQPPDQQPPDQQPPQEQQPEPNPTTVPPGMPPRTPQQIQQQYEQRQEQMQQTQSQQN